ncbi:MAG: DNA-binding response regulator, partial [Bacteroidetes bacterium]
MNELKAIIVEDEESNQKTLKNMLDDFCEGIKVVGIAGMVDDAIKLILHKKPDIVFLDIELPEKNGFQLLEYFPEPPFEVIFTTAYNKFAIKAFKFSAIDYLLKPIDLEELRNAIKKVVDKKQDVSQRMKYALLKSNMNNTFNKLTLPCSTGYVFVELTDVVRCKADGNYTNFHMKNGEKYVVSKTLGLYDQLLSEFSFFRINRQDLINTNHVIEFRRQKKSMVKMSDDSLLPVTDSRTEAYLNM